MRNLMIVLLILATFALAYVWLEVYPEMIDIFLRPVPLIKYDYAKGVKWH